MNAVAYRKYIASSSVWQKKRTAVIARAKGLCERCHRWPAVNVHHLSYANVGDEPLTDLLAVCSKCHEELHQ